MALDVFKILKDLEARIVGIDPTTNKMQEGYFTAFRTVGLPVTADDYANPFTPLGGNLDKDIPKKDPSDPKDAPTTASGTLTENQIFSAHIAKSQQSYLNTFLLVDDKLRMNNQYAVMPGAGKVSDAWWAIITGANGITTESNLSDAIKKSLAEAQAKLMDTDGNTTVHYQQYLQYEEKWKTKVKAWHRAYASALSDPLKLQTWPTDGVAYQDDADEAMDQWVGLGFKEEIDNAIAVLAAQGTDPAIALISRAKKRYINSLNEFGSVGELPYTLLLPSTWYDKDNDDGWFNYGSSDFHSELHYADSSTSYGGGGGFNVGFWRAGGSLEHVDSQASLDIKTNGLDISFSYCAVDIKRPWLVNDLLNLSNWFLVGDYKKGCISTGQMGQELPDPHVPQTFLPSVVTSLILIKNLRIKWDTAQTDWSTHMSSTEANVSVGWGPFAVNGNYKHHDQQRDFVGQWDGEYLTVEGVQILGYVSTINPLSPGVDSSKYEQKASASSTNGTTGTSTTARASTATSTTLEPVHQ